MLYSTHLNGEYTHIPTETFIQLLRRLEFAERRLDQVEKDVDRPDLKHLRKTFGMFHSPLLERTIW